jgi:hypothetical protein
MGSSSSGMPRNKLTTRFGLGHGTGLTGSADLAGQKLKTRNVQVVSTEGGQHDGSTSMTKIVLVKKAKTNFDIFKGRKQPVLVT